MHGPALARTQRRTIGGRARTRALENRLSWHRTSWCRTDGSSRGGSGGTCRRGRPQGRLIHWARSGLRNNHSRRRHYRLCGGDWSGWPGSHGWWLGRRSEWPWRRSCRRCAAGGKWRRRRRGGRSRRGWRHGCNRLRRSRRRSSKGGARRRSGHDKFRRSGGWRSGGPGGRSSRCRRRSRDRVPDGWRGDHRRSLHHRGRLLLADDGF